MYLLFSLQQLFIFVLLVRIHIHMYVFVFFFFSHSYYSKFYIAFTKADSYTVSRSRLVPLFQLSEIEWSRYYHIVNRKLYAFIIRLSVSTVLLFINYQRNPYIVSCRRPVWQFGGCSDMLCWWMCEDVITPINQLEASVIMVVYIYICELVECFS